MFRVSTLDMMNLPRNERRCGLLRRLLRPGSVLDGVGSVECGNARARVKVYTFGPTFRAENSTPPGTAEFWMIEPEIAFADLADDADLAERFLKSIFRDLLNERPDDMKFFNDRIDDGCIERVEKFVDALTARTTPTPSSTWLCRGQGRG